MERKEILTIVFVILALILVVLAISLLYTPLDEKTACIEAGYTWEPVQGKCNKLMKVTYCEIERGDACATVYQPVCGWFDTDKIRCLKYPCAQTFSNACFACLNKNVVYYTKGVCPA